MLFVCVHNSCRSQIAEEFARRLGRGEVEAYRAGSNPSGEVDPGAIDAMREVGVDISHQRPKSPDEIPKTQYDLVTTMGYGDACPFVPAERHEDCPDGVRLPACPCGDQGPPPRQGPGRTSPITATLITRDGLIPSVPMTPSVPNRCCRPRQARRPTSVVEPVPGTNATKAVN